MVGVAKETSELPGWNTTEATRVLGATTTQLSQLVTRRVLRRNAKGLFDPVDTVHAYLAYREEVLRAKWTIDGKSKARMADAKASIAELNLRERQGELSRNEQIVPAFIGAASRVRTRLLAVPSRLAPKLQTARTAVEAEAMIKAEIDEALSELSNIPTIEGARAHGAGGSKNETADEDEDETVE